MKMKYVVAFGSNLGDREKNIKDAVSALDRTVGTKVLQVSAIYETEPIDCTDDLSYLNGCLVAESSFSPNEMLGILLGIESAMGRERPYFNAPRIIDMDLIFAFDGEKEVKVSSENLTLPHPRAMQRNFVLTPLADIFCDKNIFGVCDFSKEFSSVQDQKIEKTDIEIR